ncbi:MAG: HigA family addiction module antitoxin [Candidatus Acidiferrum sp.]
MHSRCAPAPTIYQIVRQKRPISSEMALRFARFFKTTPEFWANLQASYDLRVVRAKAEQRVKREVEPLEAIA